MEKEIIFSFESILNFIDKCNKLNHELIKTIDTMGNISIPNQFESLKRVKTYHFKKRTLEFFENRINFIIDCINKKVSGLDILGNLLRGLIEIYCRVLYLQKINEEERIKKLIWHDIYSSLLIDIQFSQQSFQIIKDDYKLLKHINASIPPLQDLKKIIQESLKNLSTKNQLKKLEKEYKFKSVRQIIKEYFDEHEKPPISKYTLYKIYSLYSEQIHSNLIIEVGCKFRSIPATNSDSIRPLIPVDSGHPFRLIPDTFFRIPESAHDKALDNLKQIGHHFPSGNKRRNRWRERGYPCARYGKY